MRLHGEGIYDLVISPSEQVQRIESVRAARAETGAFVHSGPVDATPLVGTKNASSTLAPLGRVAFNGTLVGASPSAPPTNGLVPAGNAPLKPLALYLPDNRSFITWSQSIVYPTSTAVAQAKFYDDDEVTISGTWCSSSLVGTWTALTAAHCLYDTENGEPWDTTAVATGVVSNGGRDNYNPTTDPEWYVSSQTRVKNTQKWWEYDVFWPAAWETANDWAYDMGAIEFLEQDPGVGGNYLSLGWSSTSSHYSSIPANLMAYDSLSYEADAMGRTAMNVTGYADPTLRYRSYGANAVVIESNDTRFLRTGTMDITRGASGGCLAQQFVGNPGPWVCTGTVSFGDSDTSGYLYFRRYEAQYNTWLTSL